jgi:hypothetical protein
MRTVSSRFVLHSCPNDGMCYLSVVATQRNDNADDSASEGGQSDKEEIIDQHERLAARDTAARNPKEKQPTGRVVGVMKRNWRA